MQGEAKPRRVRNVTYCDAHICKSVAAAMEKVPKVRWGMFYRIIRPILKFFSPTFVWKRECPIEPGIVARDFIRNRLSEGSLNLLSSLTLDSVLKDETLAFRRRIAHIYGIATEYDLPSGGASKPSWNVNLLRNCSAKTPDSAVAEIFRLVWTEIQRMKCDNPIVR